MLSRDPPGSLNVDSPRKRRRPALSCLQCRQRKIKCDRSVPCAQCIRSRTPTACSLGIESAGSQHDITNDSSPPRYSVNLDRSSAVRTSQSTVPSITASHESSFGPSTIPAPLIGGAGQQGNAGAVGSSQGLPFQQTVLDLRERVLESDQLLSEGSPRKIPSGRFDALERTVQDLQDQLLKLEQAISEPHPTQVHSESAKALCIPVTAPRILVASDKTTFYGPSHWLYTLDQFRLLFCMNPKTQHSQRDPRHREIFILVEKCRALRRAIKERRSIISMNMSSDLRDIMPPREICDQLVNKYLGTLELVYRILHIPSFWKEYNQYWDQPQTASTRFLVRLSLILAIGTTFYQDRDKFDYIRSLAPQWIYAAQWWLTGPTEIKTQNLEGLQIYCLLLLSRQTNSLGVSKFWISPESLLAFAFKLGLHRDPKKFPDMSIFQSEMRRRLWASVLEIVIQSSLDSAMPPLISFRDSDCEAPSNIDDDEIDEATKELPTSKPSTIFTQTSLQITLSKSLRTRFDAVRFINDFSTDRSYKEVLKLGSDIQTFCHELNLFFESFSGPGHHGDHGLTRFHQNLVGMVFRRFILSLHRPFMIEAMKNPTFYFSRKVVCESSMIILSYVGDLKPSIGLVDDFSRLTALGTGIFKGALSLEAIMALCLEVTTQIDEDASTRSGNSNSVETDILNKVRYAARQPLIQILEHTFGQLLHLIAMGNASLKRYVFLAAALSQIQSTEAGEAPETAMRETIKRSLEHCYELLRDHISTKTGTDSGIQVTDNESLPTPRTGISSFDLDFSDLDLTLDGPNSWFSGWDDCNNYL